MVGFVGTRFLIEAQRLRLAASTGVFTQPRPEADIAARLCTGASKTAHPNGHELLASTLVGQRFSPMSILVISSTPYWRSDYRSTKVACSPRNHVYRTPESSGKRRPFRDCAFAFHGRPIYDGDTDNADTDDESGHFLLPAVFRAALRTVGLRFAVARSLTLPICA